MREFILTESHLKLLRRACVTWDKCEFGAPQIDPKRPYGNSDVVKDIAEILGVPFDPDGSPAPLADLERIHDETRAALQIVLTTGEFVAGRYFLRETYNSRSWERAC